MEIKELYDQMQNTWSKMQEAMTKQDEEIKQHGAASQETKTQVDTLNSKITELQNDIKTLQTQAGRPATPSPKSGKASTMTPEQRKAFEKYLRYGIGGVNSAKAGWLPEEEKALSDFIDDHGGYLVPPDFANELIEVAQNIAQIRGVAKSQTTSRNEVECSKLTQRAQVAWGNENIAVDPEELKLGLEAIPVNEVTALVLVPNSLLEDAESNVWADLTDIFGRDVAWAEDQAFSTGSGNKRPEGFAASKDVQARAVKSGAAADLANPDVLIDALYNLKVIYRANATWALNSLTEAKVRKMKDNQGRYLWAPGLAPDRPSTLLGKAVINPEGLPDVAAGTYPVVVGDFNSGYKVVDRRGLTIQRLVERYAEYRQTGFLVTKRVGGGVVLAEAFTPVVISA